MYFFVALVNMQNIHTRKLYTFTYSGLFFQALEETVYSLENSTGRRRPDEFEEYVEFARKKLHSERQLTPDFRRLSVAGSCTVCAVYTPDKNIINRSKSLVELVLT